MQKKTMVTLPWVSQTDIEPIRAIVDTAAFQRTYRVKQLGFSKVVYPNADLSRGAIMLVTWKKTKELTDRLVPRYLGRTIAHNINLFALLHDIGHGPVSHSLEALTTIDHEQNGINILSNDKELRDAIVKCGGDPDVIVECLKKNVPEYVVVDDKNLGTDKLVYLVMAHWDTDFGPNIKEVVENVFEFIKYDDGKMMVDIKALDAAVTIINTYIYFYRNLFLSKSAQKVQRFMQKMIFRLLKLGIVTEEELWLMDDEDLLAEFRKCGDEEIQFGYRTYKTGVAAFPKVGMTIRPKGYMYRERHAQKNIRVFEASGTFFENFHRNSTPERLRELECSIASLLGIPSYEVTVTNITTEDKDRFLPQDITFFDGPDVHYNFSGIKKEYFHALAGEINEYLCVRICVSPKYRQRLYENADATYKIVKRFVRGK